MEEPQAAPAAAPTSSSAYSVASSSSPSSSSISPSPTSSPATSSTSVPQHDPKRKPSASILVNPQESPANSARHRGSRSSTSASTGARAALKAAFIPQQAGKQIKSDGKPLGKSFERKVPLPKDSKFGGGQVLEVDPRGADASAGDGIVLSPDGGSGADVWSGRRGSAVSSTASEADAADANQKPILQRMDSQTVDSTSETDSVDVRQGRSVSVASAASASSRSSSVSTSTSGSTSASIRFAPLPVSGRLKRANSITIGVAARSQLLHSQGSGRSTAFPNQPPMPINHPHAMPQPHYYSQHPPRQQPQSQPSSAPRTGPQPQSGPPSNNGSSSSSTMGGSQVWYQGGPRPDDVIDLGEEISKRAKSAWKKMIKGGGGGGSASKATDAAKASAAAPGSATAPTSTAFRAEEEVDPLLQMGSTPQYPSSSSTSVGSAAAAAATTTGAAIGGESTPRRPSTPSAPSPTDTNGNAKGASDSSHHQPPRALYCDDSLLREDSSGVRTPRAGAPGSRPGTATGPSTATATTTGPSPPGISTPGESGSSQHHHHHHHHHHHQDGTHTPSRTRRLSTGALLGHASLRGMQEERRRQVLGLGSGSGGDEIEGQGQGEGGGEEGGSPTAEQPEIVGSSTSSKGWTDTLRDALSGLVPSTPNAGDDDDDDVDADDADVDDPSRPRTQGGTRSEVVKAVPNPELDDHPSPPPPSSRTTTSSSGTTTTTAALGTNDDDDDEEEEEGEEADDDDDDEEYQEAQALARESATAGNKSRRAAGVEVVRH